MLDVEHTITLLFLDNLQEKLHLCKSKSIAKSHIHHILHAICGYYSYERVAGLFCQI
jgi:hypothetical protein